MASSNTFTSTGSGLTDKVQQLSQALEHILKVADLLDSSINNHPNPQHVEFLFRPNPSLFLRLFGRPIPPSSTTLKSRNRTEEEEAAGQHSSNPYFDPVNEVKAGSSIASSCLQDITVAWLGNQGRMNELQDKVRQQAMEIKRLEAQIQDRERLGAIRSSEMFQELLQSGSAVGKATARGWQQHLSGCTCCSGTIGGISAPGGSGDEVKCPHREALADHVIDRTFDDHKQILRDRLHKAEDELALFRSGDMLKSLNAKLKESYTQRETLQKEVDQLKWQLMDIKVGKMEQRVKDSESGTLPPRSGLDHMRVAEMTSLKLQHSTEMSVYTASIVAYQGAMSQAMMVGYDLKLGIVSEALTGISWLPPVRSRGNTTTGSEVLRPTPPSSPTDIEGSSRHVAPPISTTTTFRDSSSSRRTTTIRKPLEEASAANPTPAGPGLALSSGTCGIDSRRTVRSQEVVALLGSVSQQTGNSLSGKRLVHQGGTLDIPTPGPARNQHPTDPSNVSRIPLNARGTRPKRGGS